MKESEEKTSEEEGDKPDWIRAWEASMTFSESVIDRIKNADNRSESSGSDKDVPEWLHNWRVLQEVWENPEKGEEYDYYEYLEEDFEWDEAV